MISVVLIEPENEGNIGAIARVMANFEIKELLFINPRCDPKGIDAKIRSKHGLAVLERSKAISWAELQRFDYLIATTSKIGDDYNIPRSPITPEELAEKAVSAKGRKIAIIFGRESSGLSNEEIGRCDFVVTIPSSRRYSALNISHSVTIILYEIFKKAGKSTAQEKITPISKAEKDQMMKMLKEKIDNMSFSTPEKKKTQMLVWKRMISKAFLTKREAYAIMGFFKKI